MDIKRLAPLLAFLFVCITSDLASAQIGVGSATGAQSQSDSVKKLRSEDPDGMAFADTLGASMVTLVFFGLFFTFYVFIRNKPSDGELKKIRKKKKF